MTRAKDDPFAVLEAEVLKQPATQETAKRLSATRARLIRGRDATSAFFATLALRLTLQVDWACPTMATDGRVLADHPEFVTGLSPDELLGVLVHEVMHTALAHPFRRGTRDPVQWNVAGDRAVNPLLRDAGFVLPAMRLRPGEGTYPHLPPGKSADEYSGRRATLGATPHQTTGGSGGPRASRDPGGCGGVTDPSPGSPGDGEAVAARWEVGWSKRSRWRKGGARPGGARPGGGRDSPSAAGLAGRSPRRRLNPSAQRLLRESAQPPLPGAGAGPAGVARGGPRRRRHCHRHLRLGGAARTGVFAAEVNGLLAAFACSAIAPGHDTEVKRVPHWQSRDGPLVLAPVGGDGTSHGCVFGCLDRGGSSPACVVGRTDLETRSPHSPPARPRGRGRRQRLAAPVRVPGDRGP